MKNEKICELLLELKEVKIENDYLSKINKGIAETNISLREELDERNFEIKELKQLNESLIIEKDELEYSLSECYTESELKEKHKDLLKTINFLEETKQKLFNSCSKLNDKNTIFKNRIEKLNDELEEIKIENDFLTKERDEINTILCGYRKVNGELAEEVKELKNQIEYLDECMQILVEENNKLCSLETFNAQLKTKEQHELEQATLLVDNLLEQLAKAEKEVLTLSNDKKKLQLLNERINNCITLQSQEIFKLLK